MGKALAGLIGGVVFATVAAYLIAILFGAGGPIFVLVPVGAVIGFLAGRSWGSVTRCPRCDSQISSRANVCVGCGESVTPRPRAATR